MHKDIKIHVFNVDEMFLFFSKQCIICCQKKKKKNIQARDYCDFKSRPLFTKIEEKNFFFFFSTLRKSWNGWLRLVCALVSSRLGAAGSSLSLNFPHCGSSTTCRTHILFPAMPDQKIMNIHGMSVTCPWVSTSRPRETRNGRKFVSFALVFTMCKWER